MSATVDREPPLRPSLTPAILSGSFAVAVALITGAFNWISRPAAVPAPDAPTLAVGDAEAAAPLRTADSGGAAAGAPAVDLDFVHLNFAAFQAAVKDSSAPEAVRKRAIDRCLGQTVLWQGYVSDVVANSPEAEGAWTVVLCEDRRTANQTLFQIPALCRFDDAGDGIIPHLEHGQRVTIRGECSEHSPFGTVLLHCRLTAVH